MCKYGDGYGNGSNILHEEKYLIRIEGENNLDHRDIYFYLHIYLGIVLTFAGLYFIHIRNKNKAFLKN